MRRHTEELYIADWFILGAFTWLPILYVIGYLPAFRSRHRQCGDPGLLHARRAGPVVHARSCSASPIGRCRACSHKPIYSYALGVLAFWANLVFYPLIGAHHFVFAPLPWWLQTTAIATGIGMMIPVVASSRQFPAHHERLVAHDPPRARGVVHRRRRRHAIFWSRCRAACRAFRSANALLHFTNHTVGHAHFAAYGFVSFLLFGAIYGLVPRITGAADAALRVRLHFWLALGGMALYVVAMVVAGVLQGLSWMDGRPFIDSVVANRPWYVIRAVGGGLMTLGHVVFAWNLWLMRPQPRTRRLRVPALEAAR